MASEHKETIEILAALIAIFGGIYAFWRWGRLIWRKLWHFVSRRQPRVPRETIRVVAHPRESWWGKGSVNKKPAMQIVTHFYVTNITDEEVRILGTKIIKPRKAITNGMIATRHPEGDMYGSFPVLPKSTTEVSIDFWITPPILEEGHDFKTTIVLTDQFGNEHKVKGVIFKGHKKEKKEIESTGESIYKISDPIEKEMVAVLKSEVVRYKDCGRPVGGLGSVITNYGSESWSGIGTEWRESDSPKEKSIVKNPENASITSDNATALLNLYEKIDGEEEKDRFVKKLLNRLSRETEYAPIGYLILLVLFRIGQLPLVLATAKKYLFKDSGHGFSDFLRLLDGLLRFEHPSFTSEMIDVIERFIDGLDEHTFRIRERISSIRANRLK